MLTNLWIFNPDHDMALAINSPYYVPPNSVKKMIDDLSFLPAWYAPNNSNQEVVLPYYIYKHLRESFFELLTDVKYSYDYDQDYNKIYPWGWNSTLRYKLSQNVGNHLNMPDDDYLNQIRLLSNRQTVSRLLPSLMLNDGFCGESFYVEKMDDVISLLQKHGMVVIKAPWSGSGRGVRFVEKEIYFQDQKWIERILETQQGIIVEPLYNKVFDFAMEFELTNDITFIGYSAFETDQTGSYKENILASNIMIEKMLCKFVSIDDLNILKEELLEKLKELLKNRYNGFLGVDMMICKSPEGNYKIHPCVEINLRMNMGVVSRIFYDRYVIDEKSGRYVVEYYKSGEVAIEMHNKMKSEYPLIVKNNRIESGYFSLTPVLEDTKYQIYVIVE